jgi:hypothetical protein
MKLTGGRCPGMPTRLVLRANIKQQDLLVRRIPGQELLANEARFPAARPPDSGYLKWF